MKNLCTTLRFSQTGAAIVEFALVSALFFMLLLGIVEFGRVMFYWNTATELTRMGARVAVVCDQNASAIKQRMASLYPLIPPGNIDIAYNVVSGVISEVTVRVTEGVEVVTYIPFFSLNPSLPEFRTTLPRESMQSVSGAGDQNPVCQ